MNNMINIDKKELCCGCNSCGDICPQNAINYAEDDEGFLYPRVAEDLCIECGLCEEVCPMVDEGEVRVGNIATPKCYAANHKRIDIRFKSTSGGAFTALAESFIRGGGYVGGAIYTKDWHVRQIVTNSLEDLEILRRSKYIQSNASGYYSRIKDLLKQGEKVMAVGLPCQIAALKKYTKTCDNNLITVDLICRYINSPFAYMRYIEYLEKKYKSQVIDIKAKDKELGWRRLTHRVKFKNGNTYYGIYGVDKFMQASMQANCLSRPACYSCKFKGFPRIADITIGDYWTKGEKSMLDDDIGTSVIMLNSNKGIEIFEKIKGNMKFEEVTLNKVVEGNFALVKPLPKENVERDLFYRELKEKSFDDVVNAFCTPRPLSIKRRIKNALLCCYKEIRYSRAKLMPLLQFVFLNFIHPAVNSSIAEGKVIYTTPNCVFEIDRKASIELNGYLVVGTSRFKKTKLETRLKMDAGSKLIIGDFAVGGYGFGYGSDIEIFKDATLLSEGGPSTNMNTTIICMNSIKIGGMTAVGRNVTIRDNNGGHSINIYGYRDSAPIIIGNHVWLCEGCVVMPGVKVGDGTIVSAHTIINRTFPSNVVVSGNPARIGTEDVEWKM